MGDAQSLHFKNMILSPQSPIGIFDSGIGGLTIASAIHRLMPHESLIYYGDTAHMPYGDKSPELIESYSLHISNYLYEKGCKLIVIACNTASAHAFKSVKKHMKGKLEVINVIDPTVAAVSQQFPKGKVGVVGTRGTINSGIYGRKIKKSNKNLMVTSLATPLLAPMIEEGFFNNNISRTIIHSYLSKKSLVEIDALILACTHYPLIKNEVKSFYKNNTKIFDSAEMVAQEVKQYLAQSNLEAPKNSKEELQFYVSDYTESFEKSTKFFFGKEIKLKKV